MLVSVDDRHRTTRQFRALDVLRWNLCEIDATGAADSEEVIDRFARRLPELMAENAGFPLAIRVRISGATSAHRKLTANRLAVCEKLQSVGVDLGNGSVWIEKLLIDTQPEGTTTIPEGPIAELKDYLDELRSRDESVDALLEELASPVSYTHLTLPTNREM